MALTQKQQQVLDALTEIGEPVYTPIIAEQADITRDSAYTILMRLGELGYVKNYPWPEAGGERAPRSWYLPAWDIENPPD